MKLVEKLRSLKDSIKQTAADFPSLCLWFSGGSDSRLLLEALKESGVTFSVLNFDDGLNKLQKKIINDVVLKDGLQAYSYPAVSHHLIGKDEQLSCVSVYTVGATASVPIIRDLTDGDGCAFDLKLPVAKYVAAPIEFDVHLWGTRFDDGHYSLDRVLKQSSWSVGGKAFVAPLAEWTKKEVVAALKIYGIDYVAPIDALETGNIACCSNCLKTEAEVYCPKAGKQIQGAVWDKEANAKMFRQSLEL